MLRPVLILLGLTATVGAAEDCAALASAPLTLGGLQIQMVKDQAGALHMQFLNHVEQIDRCPQVEQPWYLMLRLAELGHGQFPAMLAGAQVADARAAADRAVERFPKSARLVTIRARLIGTPEAAQAALALDPTWGPARVALAAAQVHLSDFNTAARTLAQAGDLNRMAGATTLLARAKLMSGDAAGALAVLTAPQPEVTLLEPITPPHQRKCERDRAEWTGLAALALGRTDQAIVSLVIAAADGGELARKQLRSADPPIKKAVRALLTDKRLDTFQRTWLRDFLKTLPKK